jgi:hypothetical protein
MLAMTRGRRFALSFIGVLLGAGLGIGMFAGLAEAHFPRFAPVVDVVPEPATATDPTPPLVDLATWTAAPLPAEVPWYLVATLAGLTALGARRPRRKLALALVLLLAIFAFENGVHSVHHLNDQDRGEQCVVASASQHVAGTEVDGVRAADAPAPAEPALVSPVRIIRSARSLGPHEGRAPPVSPA